MRLDSFREKEIAIVVIVSIAVVSIVAFFYSTYIVFVKALLLYGAPMYFLSLSV